MPSTVRMEGLTLPVKDVRRSIAFYGTKLGFATGSTPRSRRAASASTSRRMTSRGSGR